MQVFGLVANLSPLSSALLSHIKHTCKSNYIDMKTCMNWIIRPRVTLIITQKNIDLITQ